MTDEPGLRWTASLHRHPCQEVDFDLKPDFHPDLPEHEGHDEARFAHAMIRR